MGQARRIEPLLDPLLDPLGHGDHDAATLLTRRLWSHFRPTLGPRIEATYATHASSIEKLGPITISAHELAALLKAIRPNSLVSLDRVRDPERVLVTLCRSSTFCISPNCSEDLGDAGRIGGDLMPSQRLRPAENLLLIQSVKPALSSSNRTGTTLYLAIMQIRCPKRRFVVPRGRFLGPSLGSSPCSGARLVVAVSRVQGNSA